jgi:propanol-preferring alcohol dehydrogenase
LVRPLRFTHAKSTTNKELGIQYAKALGYKVIGIDLVDQQLEEAKASGADHTFNPKNDKDYVKKIIEITNGGCHAAVNYTNSKPAYDSTPILLRTGGVMMIVGIPQKGVTLNALEVALGKYRVKGASNGIPQKMGPCIEFSAKHNIKPHVTFYKLEQIQEMIDTLHDGKARGRLAVKFD